MRIVVRKVDIAFVMRDKTETRQIMVTCEEVLNLQEEKKTMSDKGKTVFIMLMVMLLCVSTGVWAGGQKGAATGKVVLEYDAWMWAEKHFNPMVQSVIDEYMRINPDVTIKPRGVPWPETRQKLLVSAAAGDAPDVMMIESNWPYYLSEAGVLADLGELATKEQLADLNQGTLQQGTFDGTVYATPSAMTCWGLFVNNELLKEYGVGVPQTWDEVYTNSKKFRDATKGSIYYFWIPASDRFELGHHTIWEMWNWGVFPLENLDKGETGINTAETKQWLEWRRKMGKENLIFGMGEGDAESRMAFPAFKIAIAPEGPYAVGHYRANNPDRLGGDKIYDIISVEKVPRRKASDEPIMSAITHQHAVAEQSKFKEEAWEFIWYFSTSDFAIENYITPMGAITPSESQQKKYMSDMYNNPIHQGFINNTFPYLRPVYFNDKYLAAGKFIIDMSVQATLTDDPIDKLIADCDKNLKATYGIK
jgi:ABC-type glycerol-3-phosphate transport system substrate-binding protein